MYKQFLIFILSFSLVHQFSFATENYTQVEEIDLLSLQAQKNEFQMNSILAHPIFSNLLLVNELGDSVEQLTVGEFFELSQEGEVKLRTSKEAASQFGLIIKFPRLHEFSETGDMNIGVSIHDENFEESFSGTTINLNANDAESANLNIQEAVSKLIKSTKNSIHASDRYQAGLQTILSLGIMVTVSSAILAGIIHQFLPGLNQYVPAASFLKMAAFATLTTAIIKICWTLINRADVD